MFNYYAFGLTVKSELYFPELLIFEFKGESEIYIKIGQVPHLSYLDNDLKENNLIVNSQEFFLDLPDIGKYYASKGKIIIIEPAQNCDLSVLRLFCLSNVFAALLYQRGILPIHSAGVIVNSSLVMICGKSGSGKSTLLASLLSRGFSIFSDDVCVPFLYKDQVLVSSSYPVMKFWEETIKRISSLGEPDVQLRPDLKKYGYYFHKFFSKSPVKPEYVFFLEKLDDIEQTSIREVKGYELFQYLESNAYRGEFLNAIDLRKEHFNLFSKLASQVKAYLISRPVASDSIEHVRDMVVNELQQKVV